MDREPPTIDITVPLASGMACWPGSPGVTLIARKQMSRGDTTNETLLTMDVHTGTHVEAPLHFLAGGAPLDAYPPDRFVGAAYVADVGAAPVVTAAVLDAAAIPRDTVRLLIKTCNARLWREHPNTFRKDFAGLDVSGAEWIVEHGVALVGLDYLSIAAFGHAAPVHTVLSAADVLIVEGLALDSVSPGRYHATILPLRIAGAEAAPARAMLRALRE
ncbi:MAG: cyclase family protein [bacterium]|nr:cyclase family protein [bacterium]